MIPVISFVGSSNCGKTTYLERLIAEMKRRGYRVGTIKHHLHDFDIDIPGKDTWRHSQAGADIVCISSPNKMALINKVEQEASIDEILQHMAGVDIVFTEGYKGVGKLKVEVYRKAVCTKPVVAKEELFALIADVNLYMDVPTFSLDFPTEFADYLERWMKLAK